MREAAGAIDSDVAWIERLLDDPHYINRITLNGTYPDGRLGAQLSVEVDWREYSLALETGGSDVQVPSSWTNSASPTAVSSARMFRKAVDKFGLTVSTTVRLEAEFNNPSSMEELGLVTAESRKWATSPREMNASLGGPLEEVSIQLRLGVV